MVNFEDFSELQMAIDNLEFVGDIRKASEVVHITF